MPSTPAVASPSLMSSPRQGGAAYRPWAFTEDGATTAVTVLASHSEGEMGVPNIWDFVEARLDHAIVQQAVGQLPWGHNRLPTVVQIEPELAGQLQHAKALVKKMSHNEGGTV